MPNQRHESQEYIPSETEVFLLLTKYLEGKAFTEKRKLSDGKGIYLWELGFTADDGDPAELTYARKGRFAVGGKSTIPLFV